MSNIRGREPIATTLIFAGIGKFWLPQEQEQFKQNRTILKGAIKTPRPIQDTTFRGTRFPGSICLCCFGQLRNYVPLIGARSSLHPPCTLVRHRQGIAVGQALIPLVYQQLVASCHTAKTAPFHCANHSSAHCLKQFGIIHKIFSNNTRSRV